MCPNNPLQATRWSGHLFFNRQAQRAPERKRYAPPTLEPRMVIDRLQYILSYV